MIKFAKNLTKHIRVSRGWSAVSATVQSMEIRELPPLGTPRQTKGNLTAWIVEPAKRLPHKTPTNPPVRSTIVTDRHR